MGRTRGRRTPKVSPREMDNATERLLRDQVETNRIALHANRPAHKEPSEFRSQHPQPSALKHPIDTLQPTFSQVNTADLIPTFGLFTHFVARALPIFHTMLLSAPTLQEQRDMSDTKIWTFPEPLAVLNSQQRADTWEMIGRLGMELQYDHSKDFDNSDEGMTCRLSKRPLQYAGLLGTGSMITVSTKLLEDLEDAATNGNTETYQAESRRLAILLSHEFTHATIQAVLPDNNNTEVFLGPSARTSEVGFEMEGRLFGGLFEMCPRMGAAGRLSGKIALREWPYFLMIKHYIDDVEHIETRGWSNEEMERTWEVYCEVPDEYLSGMFEESFWDKEDALHLEKRAAFVLSRNNPGYRLAEVETRDALSFMRSKGYRRYQAGLFER